MEIIDIHRFPLERPRKNSYNKERLREKREYRVKIVLEVKGVEQKRMEYCNGCGRKLKIENGILKEDIFEGRKAWGFFSKKDLTMDSFCLCEECYEEIIRNFKIPIERFNQTEAI